MDRVPDGMSSAVSWSIRQPRKTRSSTAGPISFGTAAADRQARSRNRPPIADQPDAARKLASVPSPQPRSTATPAGPSRPSAAGNSGEGPGRCHQR